MIEKSLSLSSPASADALERLRLYLPYVCEQILNLKIVSSSEIRYSCQDANSAHHIESVACALLGEQSDAECWEQLPTRAVFDNRTASCSCNSDLLPELLAGDHLIAFGPGQYGMGHLFLKTFKYFERECYRMALKQSPQEFVYPNLIPRSLMEYPDYTTDTTWFTPGTQSPEHLGKPAVCLHCYPHFRKRTIPKDLTITTQGRCYRYEGTDRFSPDRLWEFIMRESVYMGTPVFVRNSLREIENLTTGWMQNLGLRAWVQEADDPLSVPDSAFTPPGKVALKLELRIALPASGSSLAAASFNYHADRYSRPFGISEAENTAATGCAGFGIERLTWGFLAQNGLDTKRWPEAIRKEI